MAGIPLISRASHTHTHTHIYIYIYIYYNGTVPEMFGKSNTAEHLVPEALYTDMRTSTY
jgi:hypothetical protein